jgi:Ca2+-binding EF-hand superfamily protein
MSSRIALVATVAALGFTAPAIADTTGNGGDKDIYRSTMDFKTFSDSYGETGRFERIDANKDGVISRDEQMQYDFARFDADGDGGLNADEAGFMTKEYEAETAGGNPDGQ